MGEDGTLYPMELVAPHGRPPPHFSSPDLSIFLPACENMPAVPEKPGSPCVALILLLGPDLQSLWDPPSPSAELLFCCCWFFPHFPPGEEKFPNTGMEYKQKVVDSTVTTAPEAALMEERTLLHSRFPSPLTPV